MLRDNMFDMLALDHPLSPIVPKYYTSIAADADQKSRYAAKGICTVEVDAGVAQYADAAGCGLGGK